MREIWGFLMCLLLEPGMCTHSTMLSVVKLLQQTGRSLVPCFCLGKKLNKSEVRRDKGLCFTVV